MAKGKKEGDFVYEIKELLGVASPQEDLTSDWVKAVLITLMGEEKVEGIDIRNYNCGTKHLATGIRLSVQEAHNVCDILLKNGYGSLDVLEEEYNKRKNMFSGKEE